MVVPPSSTGSRGIRVGLWLAQGVLALAFGTAGATKTFIPLGDLGTSLPWVSSVPPLLVWRSKCRLRG